MIPYTRTQRQEQLPKKARTQRQEQLTKKASLSQFVFEQSAFDICPPDANKPDSMFPVYVYIYIYIIFYF